MNKRQRLKWNHQVLVWYEALEQIEVERFTDHHVRITRIRDGMRMDLWPSTGLAHWLGFSDSRMFTVKDLDDYIIKKFLT